MKCRSTDVMFDIQLSTCVLVWNGFFFCGVLALVRRVCCPAWLYVLFKMPFGHTNYIQHPLGLVGARASAQTCCSRLRTGP